MAKLSQQLQEKKEVQQGRISRTQRIAQQQSQQRFAKQQEIERLRFEELKTKAKGIQEEKFKDRVVEEKYTEEIPHQYNVNDYLRSQWYEKPDYVRTRYLENLRRSGGKIDILHKTRKKTIKFTIENGENSYRSVYENLSPDLKQFFDKPDVVLEQKAERIEQTKLKIKERQNYADQQIVREREKLKKSEDYYNRKRDQLRNQGLSSERYRDKVRDLKENLRDDENDFEEREIYWEEYKRGLGKGIGELSAGKEVSYNSVVNYADELGSYKERRKEAKNDQREFDHKQRLKIKDLEEAGYKPFVIEKSFKGKPESVKLEYYNVKTGDWKTITEYKVKSKVNVRGLEKAGFSDPQTRTLVFAGKEFKFKSRVPIYKTKAGEFVTPYEKTGITEQQIIKQSQDKAYQDYVGERLTKGIYTNPKIDPKAFTFGDTTFIPTSDIIGYVDQGSISSEQQYMQVPKIKNYKKLDINAGIKNLKKLYSKIPLGNWYLGLGGLSPFKTTKYDFDFSASIGDVRNYLRSKTGDVDKILSELDIVEPKISSVKEKYQKESQLRFEDLFAKDLIFGKITQGEAEKKYLESESYGILKIKYQKEYGEVYQEAIGRKNIGWRSAFNYGSKKFIFDTGDFLLGRIENPKKTAETGAVVVGAYYTMGVIPSVVKIAGFGALGVYGGYKFISPTSTPSEVFGGAVNLALAGITLGYGAYKYLRQPIPKGIKIPKPKIDLKATQVIRKDLKIITKQGTIEKSFFPKQKIEQIGRVGRRTVVTTKGRVLLKKYTSIKLDPIYKGVPYADPKGYATALKRLTKYGWTKTQAKATLRYYSPTSIKKSFEGVLTIKGEKAIGRFKHYTEKEILDVDKSLGIKTRGGKPMTDVIDVKRKLIKNKYVWELQKKASFKGKEIKDLTYSSGRNLGFETDFKKGYEVIGKDQYGTVIKPIKYKDAYGISVKDPLKIQISKRGILIDYDARFLKIDTSRTIAIKQQILDLTKTKYVKPVRFKKTPFSKTFDVGDDLVNQIMGKQKTTKDINKIINKIEDFSFKTQTPAQSKYYGKGLYERTDTMGGISPQLQQQLKAVTLPDQVKVINIKKLIQIKQLDKLIGLDIGQLSALGVATGIKTDLKLKTNLKLDTQLKNLLKEDVALKSNLKTQTILKTDTVLKSQLKSLLDLSIPITPLRTVTPTFRPPRTPIIKPPIPKPFIIPFLKGEISRRTGRGTKGVYEKAYLPDFTARALGLKPQTISEKQARAKLKKLLTGLEIRRGVILKDMIKKKKKRKKKKN